MPRSPARLFVRLLIVCLGVALLGAVVPAGPAGASPAQVEESRLVPALSQSFAPWTCRMRPTGPVCVGESHVATDWAPSDFPCATPVYAAGTDDRWGTRYYDRDYLNYDRRVRLRQTESLSTSPTGTAAATLTTRVRFPSPFAVPGDDSTRTIIKSGVIWDLKPATGPAVFRAVGTLVEPYDAPGTFTGHVTVDGVTTRYVDAPIDDIFTFEDFVGFVCEAATGSASLAE
jgi:hypothetical protein